MKIYRTGLMVVVVLVSASVARAETKVELKDTHLCCGACLKAANDILKTVDGVTGKSDQKTKSISITAKDDATAQKAIDALVAGGFHGTVDGKAVTVKEDSGVKKGKVKTLTVTGVHNCCGTCTSAIKAAAASVEGVTGTTITNKATTFDVNGDFEAEAVIAALNKRGFHAKLKQ